MRRMAWHANHRRFRAGRTECQDHFCNRINRFVELTNDVTKILSRVEPGDAVAAQELLPLACDERRKLAVQRMSHVNPGQTLQATVLIDEAFLRLVNVDESQHRDSRGHFCCGRGRIYMVDYGIENALQTNRFKRGGSLQRQEILDVEIEAPEIHENVVGPDVRKSVHRRSSRYVFRYS